MKKRYVATESGFTLLELIIVIAILICLMQVIFISTSYFTENKKEQAVVEMDKNINNALLVYYGTIGSFPKIHSVEVGHTYNNVSETIAEAMILKIQQVTGITINKDYSYKDYKMKIDYVNSYVMKITFEKR